MKQFTLIFTTRHRNAFAVERDCNLICECINKFTTKYKLFYNGKGVIVFHVYGADKKARHGILALLLGHMYSVTDYQSLNLQSYTS